MSVYAESMRLRLPASLHATSPNAAGGPRDTGELSIESVLREGVRGGEGSWTLAINCGVSVSGGRLRTPCDLPA